MNEKMVMTLAMVAVLTEFQRSKNRVELTPSIGYALKMAGNQCGWIFEKETSF